MKPIENEKSDCFGCTAFILCNICKGEQYDFDMKNNIFSDITVEKKMIIRNKHSFLMFFCVLIVPTQQAHETIRLWKTLFKRSWLYQNSKNFG